MQRRKKMILGGTLALAVVGTGAGIGIAAGGDDDRPLRGGDKKRAVEAALDHTDGGTVLETEVGDDGAAYGVEIEKQDGSVFEVELDENFNVTGTEQDDDGSDRDDGDEGEDK